MSNVGYISTFNWRTSAPVFLDTE
ncbi:BH4_AAA_HYDROXYL_2 domain-containing protein [Caenorhabditis elegans]|uniref:BH4_AAA_HYDROXYL_2 domain-containing protein n=1 Tax=Caenorhabditis elegans TaxID=6239 RepID=A0A078BQL6_CAEEL|nr:BH4_AAA_HYDROXYL_2 domain-containing protein [Caenorhabditis elegans]CDX47470.1 BH4_AAA_HYDROXYL_2 domain-containing protein [Caenorhabditis elegans]|eukprot:NP_001294105.1 Uncharacterized protein CELE_F38C2.1 [Caenorhabditis elegans]